MAECAVMCISINGLNLVCHQYGIVTSVIITRSKAAKKVKTLNNELYL